MQNMNIKTKLNEYSRNANKDYNNTKINTNNVKNNSFTILEGKYNVKNADNNNIHNNAKILSNKIKYYNYEIETRKKKDKFGKEKIN